MIYKKRGKTQRCAWLWEKFSADNKITENLSAERSPFE